MFFVGSIINIIVLIPLYLTSKENIKDVLYIDKSQFSLLFISQILVIVAGLAILTSVKYLNAPLASIFEISYPFFVVIFYVLFFNGNNLNTNFWIGAILMFIGSLVIIK